MSTQDLSPDGGEVEHKDPNEVPGGGELANNAKSETAMTEQEPKRTPGAQSPTAVAGCPTCAAYQNSIRRHLRRDDGSAADNLRILMMRHIRADHP